VEGRVAGLCVLAVDGRLLVGKQPGHGAEQATARRYMQQVPALHKEKKISKLPVFSSSARKFNIYTDSTGMSHQVKK
jgi:hypothetical protein